MSVTTRFAPSPTGLLHLGHVYSAWVGRQAARAGGGRFLLRIEDIDQSRCRPAFEAAIFEDLAWLGLNWDGPVLRQSERLSAYRDALVRLSEREVLYPCFCSRREIRDELARLGQAPHGVDGPVYPGTCRALPSGERDERIGRGDPYALRLDVAGAVAQAGPVDWYDQDAGRQRGQPAILGDVILSRKEGPASYHLAVVVDDATQGVDMVTRGLDLFHATHVQRLLQSLLGYPEPRYLHHRLITDAAGQRLAKRSDALSVCALREAGLGAGEILEKVGATP